MISRAWFLANNTITPQQSVWVAYSGGVDSHVLLHLAQQCFPNVRAIHINHNLSTQDAQWQQHCKTVCAQLNIPLQIVTVDANPTSDQSLEEAARLARRIAWRNLLKANDVLLLAHHADDQAETVLFRLLRGTGPKGLGGIKAISKIGPATIWRPLLGIRKQEILDYAIEHDLKWCLDASNIDNKYDRNYLRNKILPLMLQRWPAAIANINRAAKLCAQQEEFIASEIMAVTTALMDSDKALNLSKFYSHNLLWQQAIIRAWLQHHHLIPSEQHIIMILAQVINARIDAMPQYIIGEKVVRRSKNKLYLLDSNTSDNLECEIFWDLEQDLLLPTGVILKLDDISHDQQFIAKLRMANLTVRFGKHGAKAKKIFQKYAIPAWERNKYPLLFANNRLVAIVGLWTSPRF